MGITVGNVQGHASRGRQTMFSFTCDFNVLHSASKSLHPANKMLLPGAKMLLPRAQVCLPEAKPCFPKKNVATGEQKCCLPEEAIFCTRESKVEIVVE